METVYLNGQPVHVSGSLPEVGSQAPDFELVSKDLSDIKLGDFKGKRLVLNIFPSLDTDVCARSVRKFNEEVAKLENTEVLCVSKDLPFAAERFCSLNGINNARPASAFRSDFGHVYGVELEDGPLRGLFARAVVVIDAQGNVVGSKFSRQITEEPDYGYVIDLLK